MKIALKFALVLCAGAMIFGACGGKNAAVKAFEDYASSVCACKDVKCATDATNAFQKKAKDLAKSAGSASEADKKAVAAATTCKMTSHICNSSSMAGLRPEGRQCAAVLAQCWACAS